ncbi:carbamoyl phosphate synthase small subunit [Caldalkalibacillus salinus]|uniref:carbamoyl phosphate synthase small subunit n=1 Tax=Caldalkalibacillus salinus TaxID=2803787 RepID=UPI00301873D3
MNSKKGYLLLENGEVMEGEWLSGDHHVDGEMVFNTSMYGYQEILSDPSYRGQILCFCYPLLGNYGINTHDYESAQFQVSGVILEESSEHFSHYEAKHSLLDQFQRAHIPVLGRVDTRALVKMLRQTGELRGYLTDQKLDEATIKHQLETWQTAPLTSSNRVHEVSVKQPITYEGEGLHIGLIDYGYKKSILKSLQQRGCQVTVFPYTTTYEQVKAVNPDGLLFSNGPGDPMALAAQLADIKKMSIHYPSLGICLGHQLLALAHGASTTKLEYGHRGGNHPVKDVHSGKVYMTAQNHGYVVTEETLSDTPFTLTFRNVNDHTIEGLRHQHYAIQTVQFHPEAHSGPQDTAYIFDQFLQEIQSTGEIGEIEYAAASGHS